MKFGFASLLGLLLLATTLAAQTSAVDRHSSTDPASAHAERAVIEGFVTKDPSGEPVKKAVIELIAENQATGGNYTATSGLDGRFHIDNILPGSYRLMVERVGFLEVVKHRPQAEGRVLALASGQELKGLLVRMQASAVVEGRVTDEDGEPMPNAQVTVLHQTFASGRSRWESTGGQPTNDLGEYRIANLPAGSYLLSVTPAPDFRSLIESAGLVPHDVNASASGQDKLPASSYLMTYYPGTRERSQASPIELQAGDDFPANFSLTPGPTVIVRGSVTTLPVGTSGMVMLQSKDSNETPLAAQIRRDGTFEMHGVPSGSYTVVATVSGAGASALAAQTLQVGSTNIEALRLSPQAGAWIRGHLRIESKASIGRFSVSQIYLSLVADDGGDAPSAVSMSDGFTPQVHVEPNGSFEWKSVPPGHYHIEFSGDDQTSPDWFLKSVAAGGRDVTDSGFTINGGSAVVDLVASSDGALVQGVSVNAKGEPMANAVVVIAPEMRLRSRVDRFRRTVSDQSGRFTLHGVPPGSYTLIAWESVATDACYNPQFLRNYEQQGQALRVSEGDRKSVQIVAIPAPQELQ